MLNGMSVGGCEGEYGVGWDGSVESGDAGGSAGVCAGARFPSNDGWSVVMITVGRPSVPSTSSSRLLSPSAMFPKVIFADEVSTNVS
jgi:hypothetical protein